MDKVFIYSDYVCPFCFLEIPALERLAEEEGVELEWRAFELRPEPVPTLEPRGPYLINTWQHSVYPLARRLGIPIQLPPLQPRSRLAFEGAEYAREQGRVHEYNKAVFEAFFQEGKDIGNLEVLGEIAGKIGLDQEGFCQALQEHRYLARVLEQEEEAIRQGIHAVPTVVIGGQPISGAVPYNVLQEALRAARAAGNGWRES